VELSISPQSSLFVCSAVPQHLFVMIVANDLKVTPDWCAQQDKNQQHL
jgi:hypothetical protein